MILGQLCAGFIVEHMKQDQLLWEHIQCWEDGKPLGHYGTQMGLSEGNPVLICLAELG